MIQTLQRGLVDSSGRPLQRVGSRLITFEDWVRAADARRHLSPTVRAAKRMRMADTGSWMDTLEPWVSYDCASVTLAATAKALYAVKDFPALGSAYFNRKIGKGIAIWMFGGITTAATPGNGSFDIYYGSGVDATGTVLKSSAALALSASQADVSWWLELIVRTSLQGTVGTLRVSGKAGFNVGVLASTLQPMLIPASGTIVSGTVDLTSASIISVQFKRSGSTAETMIVRELNVVSLN